MKKQNKILVALLAAAIGVAGLAGVAAARGGCYGGGHWGGHYGGGYYGGGMNMAPETREIVQKFHTSMGPLYMELQAKRQELTAKTYSGADENSLKGLVSEVNALQNRLNEAGADMHKQLAKAGVTLNGGMMNCPVMGGAFHGQGYGGRGFHGGPRHGGMGFHGAGGCPYYMQGGPSAQTQ